MRFLSTMNDIYAADLPDELIIDSTWACETDKREGEVFGVSFPIHFDGNEMEFGHLMDRSAKNEKLTSQIKLWLLPEESTHSLHETFVTKWEGIKRAYPANPAWILFGYFIFKKDRATIEPITNNIFEIMNRLRIRFTDEKVLALASFIHTRGKVNKKKR